MKTSKSKRPETVWRQCKPSSVDPTKNRVITTDREGGLPIPAELSRRWGICIGDDYAVWKKGRNWIVVFPKSAGPQVRIPKAAYWGKVERALPNEPQRTSGAKLARRLARMKPQPETAKAVANAIKAIGK